MSVKNFHHSLRKSTKRILSEFRTCDNLELIFYNDNYILSVEIKIIYGFKIIFQNYLAKVLYKFSIRNYLIWKK